MESTIRIILSLFCGLLASLGEAATDPCSEPLGLEDGNITDAQMTASSVSGSFHPGLARLNNEGTWRPTVFNNEQYLIIDFLMEKNLTKLAIQGSPRYNLVVTKFRLFYSLDGTYWEAYNTLHSSDPSGESFDGGTTDTRAIIEKNLNPPIQARYVAINPIGYRGGIGMRLEFYGCNPRIETPSTHVNITADIERDEIWLLNLSPYIVKSEIFVRSLAKLTIQPGVKVVFESGASLVIQGQLNATGLPSLPILFTSREIPITAAVDWEGLSVAQGGNVLLKHVEIRRANTGVTGAADSIIIVQTSVYLCRRGMSIEQGSSRDNHTLITDSAFLRNSENGVFIKGSQVFPYIKVQGCSVLENTGSGIRVEGFIFITIRNSTASSNGMYGIFYQSSNGGWIDIDGSLIENNRNGLYIYRDNVKEQGKMTITRNTIQNNNRNGLYLYESDRQVSIQWHIADNIIMGHNQHAMDLRIYIYPTGDANITIRNNSFIDEASSYYTLNINLDMRQEYIYADISENTFLRCRNGLYWNMMTMAQDSEVLITSNTFVSIYGNAAVFLNLIKVQVLSNIFANCTCPSVLKLSEGIVISLKNNKFMNPEAKYELEIANKFNNNLILNASYNYWGSENEFYVRSRVCDVLCNMAYARITLSPYFTDIDLLVLANNSAGAMYSLDGSGHIGGTLEKDVYLAINQSYIVGRTIIIPDGKLLTINKGASLKFKAGTGFIVTGTMMAHGTEESFITMDIFESGRWAGIYLDGRGINMSYAIIKEAENVLNFQASSPTTIQLHHVHVNKSNTVIRSVLAGNVSIVITQSTFTRLDYGLYLTLSHLTVLSLQVHDSTFQQISRSGIYLDDSRDRVTKFGEIILTSVVMEDVRNTAINVNMCNWGIITLLMSNATLRRNSRPINWYTRATNVTIETSEFSYHQYEAVIHVCGENELYRHISLTNNTFLGASYSSDLSIYLNYDTNHRQHNIVLLDNLVSHEASNSHRGLKITCQRYCGVYARNNIFRNISESLYVYLSSSAGGNVTLTENSFFQNSKALFVSTINGDTSVLIQNNTFWENKGTPVITMLAGNSQVSPMLFLENTLNNNNQTVIRINSPARFHYNVFQNPHALFNIRVDQSDKDLNTINATLNFWDVLEPKEISRKIYDKGYDRGLPEVVFVPFLGSHNTWDVYDVEYAFLGANSTIGGEVNGNVTLNADDSPYVVVTSIIVGLNDVLTLEPGCILLFEAGQGIFAEGSLNVSGSESRPVVMMPKQDGQYWAGIDILGTEATTASSLQYLIINSTNRGIQINGHLAQINNVYSTFSLQHGITIDFERTVLLSSDVNGLLSSNNVGNGVFIKGYEGNVANISISVCNVSHNEMHGLLIEGDVNATLTMCTFSFNSDVSIDVNYMHGGYGSLIIRTSTFNNNKERAIRLNSYINRIRQWYYFHVVDSTFADHDLRNPNYWNNFRMNPLIDISAGSMSKSMWSISNCTFADNMARSVFIVMSSSMEGLHLISIDKNIFRNNTGQVINIQQPSTYLVISENAFDSNSVYLNEDLLLINLNNIPKTTMTITKSLFRNNTAPGILTLSNSRAVYENITISENKFVNNTAAVTISLSSFGISVQNNVFSNPNATCELAAPPFRRYLSVDALFNYWNSDAFSIVIQRVCGFDINMDLGYVQYIPFFINEAMTDVTRYPEDLFYTEDIIGGPVTGPRALVQNTVNITRSILISPGAELYIPAGVHVAFAENRGIFAEGSLTVGGNFGERTVFSPTTDNTSWYGVVFPRYSGNVGIRLVDGSSSNEGRIEVLHQGEFGTICDDGFDDDDARVVCSLLGYERNGDVEVFGSAYFGQGAGQIWLDDLACTGNELRLEECKFSGWGQHNCGHSEDVGVSCLGTQISTENISRSNSVLRRLDVIASKNGILIERNMVNLSMCMIYNTTFTGLTIRDDVGLEFDLDGSSISQSGKYGVYVNSGGKFTLRNLTVSGSRSSGIYLDFRSGDIHLSDITLSNNTGAGIDATFSGRYRPETFILSNSLLQNHLNNTALKLITLNHASSVMIEIRDNQFINNTGGSIEMDLPKATDTGATSNRNASVINNEFIGSGKVFIRSRNYMNITIADNKFISGNSSGCILDVNIEDRNAIPNKVIDISANLFENNTGRCIVSLASTMYNYTGIFQYNHLVMNNPKTSTMLLDTPYFDISYNIFDNSLVRYDVRVVYEGSTIVPAENNWWGSKDIYSARSRIFDQLLDPQLLMLDIEPLLTDQGYECNAVDNCSAQGQCIRPNICRCHTGWTGSNCSGWTCADVNDCYGSGICVGPNECDCNDGWTGDVCVVATCINVNNCSKHGFCRNPDQCVCYQEYTGADCASCSAGRWGMDCSPCPKCLHGSCNATTGGCTCVGPNWTGDLCDTCSFTFYGPECLPLINILTIAPNEGPDSGGIVVNIRGHNFPHTTNQTVFCKFGSVDVVGQLLSREHIICVTPQLPAQSVYLEISVDGVAYTNNEIPYTSFAQCPESACGKHLSPAHGQCLYGGCLCTLPWTGDDCSVELKHPVIVDVPSQTVREGMVYKYKLQLSKGSQPIQWKLRRGPLGMDIDSRTGLVLWNQPIAAINPHVIAVRASNLIGHDDISWNIYTPLSYNATIDFVSPRTRFATPSVVEITGHVTYFGASSRVAFVDIRVMNGDRVRTKSVFTDPLAAGQFSVVFYPQPDDSGIFQADARHPSDSRFAAQVEWSVLGMQCNPGTKSVSGYLDTNDILLENVAHLINSGPETLYNISTKALGLSYPLLEVRPIVSNSTASGETFIRELNPMDKISIDVLVKADTALNARIAIVFTASEGTTTQFRLNLALKYRKAILQIIPSALDDTIVIGSQRIYDISITNIGEAPATDVQVSLPNDLRFSVVSFAMNDTHISDTTLTFQPQDSAILSLSVTSFTTDSIGEIQGSIAINSELVATTISYKFYVTSVNYTNLTVKVEDEYTYFASDKPLVRNATLVIKNPRRNINIVATEPDASGLYVINNLYEDQYTLEVTAPGHSSSVQVILVRVSSSEITVFLQRIAVQYTWTVTPTTFDDKYIITLDSTFETQVPMPVVTIDPINVNLLPYEQGQKTLMEFVVTNHGLIRADNLRFNIPSSHPSLSFKSMINNIVELDANATIVLPINVTLKNRRKRSVGGLAVCGLVLLYDYDCGGTRTRNIDVTLSRQHPGRPPMPCGGTSIGGGSSSGSLGVSGGASSASRPSSSVVVYNPVTPMSCDCAKTLMKSCALAFHPIAGCAMAVVDLGTASSFLSRVVGAADTAFACVFSISCPLCGMAYTVARCLIDIDINCNSARRRRRDISSAIVNKVLASAGPFTNFLALTDEIFSDNRIYDIGNYTWFREFKKSVGDASPGGEFLLDSEVTAIQRLVNLSHAHVVENFLLRWNATASVWKSGNISTGEDQNVISHDVVTKRTEKYQIDTHNALAEGHDTIFDRLDHTMNVYKEAEKNAGKDDGVCAKVRVRITQEVVLTREAFNARLEIENGENFDLQDIEVIIEIRDFLGAGLLANRNFSIGAPSLVGISGVDGQGVLPQSASGYAEWLIVPYPSAAIVGDVQYDVGGRLSYRVGRSNFSILLLPDTITVKPNPSLVLRYFHEKHVQGDDATTEDVIEPVVPFSLAVMVTNDGYGVARNLKITSAQPEIIENVKGLLVSFKIIGAQLNGLAVTPSLSIDFGDIISHETKTARWLLTSSLKGTFYNYTATFENINPLGDPELSVMSSVSYHELVHLVRITEPADDQQSDFLVNDIVDVDELPDKIYDSDTSEVHNVNIGENIEFNLLDVEIRGKKEYTIVTHIVNTNASGWVYSRIVNDITAPPTGNVNHLLSVVRNNDSKEILVENNAWLTTYYHDLFYFHLLDFVSNISGIISYTNSYNVVFGPRNLYSPIFSEDIYDIKLQGTVKANDIVTIVNATDKDENNMTLSVRSSEFKIDEFGQIMALQDLVPVNMYSFEVFAVDDGIPSRTSSVTVKIFIDEPEVVTLPTSTPTSSSSTQEMNITLKYSITYQETNTTLPPNTTSASSDNITVTVDKLTTESVHVEENITEYVTDSTSYMHSVTSESDDDATASTEFPEGSTEREVPTESERQWVLPVAISAGIAAIIIIIIVIVLIVLYCTKSSKKAYWPDHESIHMNNHS